MSNLAFVDQGRPGPIPPHPTPTRKSRNGPERPFLAQLAPSGPSPHLPSPRLAYLEVVALGNLQKCVGGFLLYKFWRIFPGIFLEDFSGHFSHKNEEKKSGEKIREKSGGSKIKIREKSVLPKAGPKSCFPPYNAEPPGPPENGEKLSWEHELSPRL